MHGSFDVVVAILILLLILGAAGDSETGEIAKTKLDALREKTAMALAAAAELSRELHLPPRAASTADFLRAELSAFPSRFRPLRPLDSALVRHTPAWKSRGLDEVQPLDDSFHPAHCFWRKQELLCLPSFFILGTPKSGTTALWGAISSHPDVLNVRKEPHWWATGKGRIVPCTFARTTKRHLASSIAPKATEALHSATLPLPRFGGCAR